MPNKLRGVELLENLNDKFKDLSTKLVNITGSSGGYSVTPPASKKAERQQAQKSVYADAMNLLAAKLQVDMKNKNLSMPAKDKMADKTSGSEMPQQQQEQPKEKQKPTLKDRFGSFFGSVQSGMQKQSSSGHHADLTGMGEVMGGIGKLAGAIPVIGPALEGVTKFGAMLLKGVDNLRNWNESLIQGNLRFGEFSAAMAGTSMRDQMRKIQLDRQKGDARAQDTEELSRAQNELDKNLLPLENFWSKVKTRGSAAIARHFNSVINAPEDFANWTTGKKKVEDKKERLDNMADMWGKSGKQWQEDYGVPLRLK